jgi:perosamine synthetase
MANPSIPWWNIEVGEDELARVTTAMRQRTISQGRITTEFEEALATRLGVAHVVCTTSGTMALTMAYMAAGIGPGDEIIVPNRTWIATANAALILGAKVKVVDIKAGDITIDPDLIEPAIGTMTKAIVPVSLNGKAVEIDRIKAIADRHGLAVIEDACQSLFSRLPDGRHMGTTARFSCFSMGMAKALTTGAGGFIACDDEADATTLRRIRNQGMSDYDLSERHAHIGSNFKFTDIQSAIGLGQLQRADGRIERQRATHRLYAEGLAGLGSVRLIPVDIARGEVPMRVELVCSDRLAFQAALSEEGIGSSRQVPNVADFPFIGADPASFPRSLVYGDSILVPPCGPEQPSDNIHRAIEVIRRIAPRFRPLD